MQTHSKAITIGEGLYAGWELVATHLEDEDAMDDLYTLDLWPPDADEPAHSFATYRYALGWNVIDEALGDGDRMRAAMEWWTNNHSTTPYEIHRILATIDATTWASRNEIAQRLRLPVDELRASAPYGEALAAAERHGLIEWRNQRATPYAALTPLGYDLIHPDDQPTVEALRQELGVALSLEQGLTPASPAAGKAFLRPNRVFAHAAVNIAAQSTAPALDASVRDTRHA